jgi:hypothetical protein
MNRMLSVAGAASLLFLTASFVLKGDDTSAIENKNYKVTITDSKKAGKAGEVDEVLIKGGKFRCKFFGKNAGTDAIPIEVTIDSVYTDPEDPSADPTLYVEFEGSMTNKLEEDIRVEGIIDGVGIEGFVEISKKGKVKKHWDYVGRQRDKK